MAKIVGPVPPFIGTRDNVTIYLMNGEYIARSKSSLTGKRVKKDPAFARTMEWAGRLKQGARIASFIYKQMPVEGRIYKQYREITGKAMSLLKEGFNKGDIITMLEVVYLPQQEKNTESIITSIKPTTEQENNGAYNIEHPIHSVDTMICNGVYNSESPVHSVDAMVCDTVYNSEYLVHSLDTMVCNGVYNSESPVHSVDAMVCDNVYNSEYLVHSVDTMVCDSVYNSEHLVHSVDAMVCNGVYNNRYILCDQYSHCNQSNQTIQRDKKAKLISVKLQSY